MRKLLAAIGIVALLMFLDSCYRGVSRRVYQRNRTADSLFIEKIIKYQREYVMGNLSDQEFIWLLEDARVDWRYNELLRKYKR